jgi:hypothetical protein
MVDWQRHRDKIVGSGAWSALEELRDRAHAAGLVMQDTTGFIPGVKFYREDVYAFAFQSGRHHLNFYIRKPAKTRWGPLESAKAGLTVARERKGETQIHLRSAEDAKILADRLFNLP